MGRKYFSSVYLAVVRISIAVRMRTEEQTKPQERYLFAEEYLSDKLLAIIRADCIRRGTDQTKGPAYEKYISWVRQDNEIAVYTLHAYADFSIPKKFDIIFNTENPDNCINIEFELTQSIFEAGYPFDSVYYMHKHICIFRFDQNIPDIFNLLYKRERVSDIAPKGQTMLGFCNSSDFDSIKKRVEGILQLKKDHGEKWLDFDNE